MPQVPSANLWSLPSFSPSPHWLALWWSSPGPLPTHSHWNWTFLLDQSSLNASERSPSTLIPDPFSNFILFPQTFPRLAAELLTTVIQKFSRPHLEAASSLPVFPATFLFIFEGLLFPPSSESSNQRASIPEVSTPLEQSPRKKNTPRLPAVPPPHHG